MKANGAGATFHVRPDCRALGGRDDLAWRCRRLAHQVGWAEPGATIRHLHRPAHLSPKRAVLTDALSDLSYSRAMFRA